MGSFSGHHHTAETKAKISQVLLAKHHGVGNKYALGYRFTEEQKVARSKALMGRPVTEETRMKISRAQKGKTITAKERAILLQYNIERANGTRICSPETRAKLSQAGRGRKDSEETRVKKSQARIGMKFSPEHCANMGKGKKLAWQDPEWRDKVVKAQRIGKHTHPNHAETEMLELLNQLYPRQWAFVGDGSLIINGKNPDFINTNGRKIIIELFGNYWHKKEEEQERIAIFDKYGFSTLIIWDTELPDKTELTKKIIEFVSKPH